MKGIKNKENHGASVTRCISSPSHGLRTPASMQRRDREGVGWGSVEQEWAGRGTFSLAAKTTLRFFRTRGPLALYEKLTRSKVMEPDAGQSAGGRTSVSQGASLSSSAYSTTLSTEVICNGRGRFIQVYENQHTFPS